jgi:hypothetical protein
MGENKIRCRRSHFGEPRTKVQGIRAGLAALGSRTLILCYDHRRLSMDYERLLKTSRAMLRLAAIRLMLNRLAPPPKRPVWTSPGGRAPGR